MYLILQYSTVPRLTSFHFAIVLCVYVWVHVSGPDYSSTTYRSTPSECRWNTGTVYILIMLALSTCVSPYRVFHDSSTNFKIPVRYSVRRQPRTINIYIGYISYLLVVVVCLQYIISIHYYCSLLCYYYNRRGVHASSP